MRVVGDVGEAVADILLPPQTLIYVEIKCGVGLLKLIGSFHAQWLEWGEPDGRGADALTGDFLHATDRTVMGPSR